MVRRQNVTEFQELMAGAFSCIWGPDTMMQMNLGFTPARMAVFS